MLASSTASSTMVRACDGWRCGSLFFTKLRMRWMIWPARCACREVFSSAAIRSPFSMALFFTRVTMPLQ